MPFYDPPLPPAHATILECTGSIESGSVLTVGVVVHASFVNSRACSQSGSFLWHRAGACDDYNIAGRSAACFHFIFRLSRWAFHWGPSRSYVKPRKATDTWSTSVDGGLAILQGPFADI